MRRLQYLFGAIPLEILRIDSIFLAGGAVLALLDVEKYPKDAGSR